MKAPPKKKDEPAVKASRSKRRAKGSEVKGKRAKASKLEKIKKAKPSKSKVSARKRRG